MTTDLFKQIHALKAYLYYWLVQEDRYAIQSPFVFEVYDGLLNYLKFSKNRDRDIEDIRKKLLADDQVLDIVDFGAGSKKLKSRKRETFQITRHSTTGRKFSLLYQYFCGLTPAVCVIELGTCVGLNTLYLSRFTKGIVYTFEGSEALLKKAKENLSPKNIQYQLGNIQQTLPDFLDKNPTIDFALIDATHTYTATMAYFSMIIPHITSESILAIADIHWSREMENAWNEIKKHPAVTLSLDFYECGILIFKKDFPKSHYILNY